MPRKPRQHVVPHEGKWGVRREGSPKVSRYFGTQGDAIDWGRGVAKNQETELVIHRRDGSIRDSDSYGNDPAPPIDKKH